MFDFVQSIVLNISWALSFVSKDDVFSLLVVFVLGDSKIHICTIYSGNMTSDIEVIINELLWDEEVWEEISLYISGRTLFY